VDVLDVHKHHTASGSIRQLIDVVAAVAAVVVIINIAKCDYYVLLLGHQRDS